jgi:hypothetical protein
MVVVGVDAAAFPGGGPVSGGVTWIKSAPSTTVAPSLRNSVAMAAMRSVSLTRQLAILRSVVVPFAYKRHDGQGHGGIGDVVAVQVNGLQRPGATADVQPVGAAANDVRPFGICAASIKRMSP